MAPPYYMADTTNAVQAISLAASPTAAAASITHTDCTRVKLNTTKLTATIATGSAPVMASRASGIEADNSKPAPESSTPRMAPRTRGELARAPNQRIIGITRNAGVITASKAAAAPGTPDTK